jgi:hypothetical protein
LLPEFVVEKRAHIASKDNMPPVLLEALSVYIVWEKIGPADAQEVAAQASALLVDPRIHHFWSPERFTSRAFHDEVGAQRTLA